MTTKMNTTDEIQALLSDQMNRIVADETTPAKVNAVVNATGAFLRVWKMQMDYHKQIGKTPNIPALLTGGGE